MADEFFDDEQELMEAAEAEASAPRQAASGSTLADRRAEADVSEKAAAAAPRPDRAASTARTDAPPFWMVLLIAVVALVLGVVIGYLMGSASALSALEAQQEQYQAEAQAQTTDDADYGLPEGHPEVSVDEDGTAHIAEDAEDASDDADAASAQ